MRNRDHKKPGKALFVGAISGLVGTLLMTQFQNVWNKIAEEKHKANNEGAESKTNGQKEDSTMKAAGKLSKGIGHPLSREERKKAGLLVHYAFGTFVGSVYGMAKEIKPNAIRGTSPVLAGAAYGVTVFLAAHEVAVPALKLSSNPLKERIPDQIAELASHLIYGVGTALTYEGINKLNQ